MAFEGRKRFFKLANTTLTLKRAVLSLRCVSQDQTTVWIEQRAVRERIKPARLNFASSVGIVKTLSNKNVTKKRLHKSFGTLLRRYVLKQRRCMCRRSKSWSCVRKSNQRSLAVLRKRLNALKERLNVLLLVYNKRGKIFSQKLLNKSLKLWLNLKIISKSARNKRSGCCIRNKLFCQRTSLLDFHIKRTKCLKRSFTA